jgi:protein SCO1/2
MMKMGCSGGFKRKVQKVAAAALWALSFSLASTVLADARGLRSAATGMTSAQTAPELEGIGIDEKMGQTLDLSLQFKDENGKTVTLGDYINPVSHVPVIISPVYYSCPGLCNFHLNGLVDGLKGLDWTIGEKFKVIAISFDPKEKPEVALKKKASYMKVYGRPQAESDFHFLTGEPEAIQKFTSSVGFKYRWNEKEKEWAHASAAIVVSPTGTITRYLPGIMFEPKDIKLALTEASAGKIGTFVDQLVLYCFQYNPHQSKYTLYAFNVMKLGGGLMILVLALWLLPIWIRSRRTGAKPGEELRVHDVV